jgi:hypothetical protein
VAAPGGAPHRCFTSSIMGSSEPLSVAFCVTRWATIKWSSETAISPV